MNNDLAPDQDEGERESMWRYFLSPAIIDALDTNPEAVEGLGSQWLSVFFIAIQGFEEATETGVIERDFFDVSGS
jgi:hypothetical protein